jgi:hypothetical protein
MPLWTRDIPFEVVADHPRVYRRDVERLEGTDIDARVGLAEADLAFDENHIEQIGESEAIDLLSLRVGGSVGQQCQTTASISKPLNRRHSFIDGANAMVAQEMVSVSDLRRKVRIVKADVRERKLHDLAPRRSKIESTHPMALRIGPVPLANPVDRFKDNVRIDIAHVRTLREARFSPAGHDVAAVVEDRVVEIEQKGLGEADHRAEKERNWVSPAIVRL